MYIMKFHEVLKNYMKPEPAIGSWNNLLVNTGVWKKLTPEQRAVIETAALGCGTTWSFNDTRITGLRSLNDMVNKWQVKVNTVPEEELQKMRKASLALQEEMAKKDALSAKAVALLREYMKEMGYEN